MDEPPTSNEELTTRIPEEADLVALCRTLNDLGARYVVIGGFAMILAGFARATADVDLLIDTSLDNEALVYKALEILPDKAVRELKPGETSQYGLVRVGDEIMVDLIKSASGIEYAEASKEIAVREVQGVPIPFAFPRFLWRTKKPSRRPKHAEDLMFLQQYFREHREEPTHNLSVMRTSVKCSGWICNARLNAFAKSKACASDFPIAASARCCAMPR